MRPPLNIEAHQRCRICQCFLDVEDLFCANCGTENSASSATGTLLAATHTSFDCGSCGASMSYDAESTSLRCPYCGSTAHRRQSESRFAAPSHCLAFAIEFDAAQSIFRRWLGRGFWRPSNLRQAARLGEVTKVYVPYWSFSAEAETRWTADASPAPAGSQGDWYPVSGIRRGSYRDLLVCGSRVLSHAETESVAPFDWAHSRPIVAGELARAGEAIVEQFQVPRKTARPVIRRTIERLELAACSEEVRRQRFGNASRNVHANVQIASMVGQPVLIPIWILAYTYRSQVHRVLINGQSGKIAGSAPFSYLKLVGVLAAFAILLALCGAIAMLSSG